MTKLNMQAINDIVALQRTGKPNLLGRVIELYRSESPNAIVNIEYALEEADLETIRINAHSLKSSSAYLGATDLSECMSRLEAAAREGNLPECVALNESVRDMYDEVMSELVMLIQKAA